MKEIRQKKVSNASQILAETSVDKENITAEKISNQHQCPASEEIKLFMKAQKFQQGEIGK